MKLKFTLSGVLLFAVLEAVISLLPFEFMTTERQFLLGAANLLFVVFYLLGTAWLGKRSQRPQAFVTNFMGFTAMKMFVALMFMVILAVNFRESVTVFLLGSMVIYFSYTILEVLVFRTMAKKTEEN